MLGCTYGAPGVYLGCWGAVVLHNNYTCIQECSQVTLPMFKVKQFGRSITREGGQGAWDWGQNGMGLGMKGMGWRQSNVTGYQLL